MKDVVSIRKGKSALEKEGSLDGSLDWSISALRRSRYGSVLHYGVEEKHCDTILCGQYSCMIGGA